MLTVRAALEALDRQHGIGEGIVWDHSRPYLDVATEVLEAVVADQIAAEREACAKIADEWARSAFGLGAAAVKDAALDIARSIRNRATSSTTD